MCVTMCLKQPILYLSGKIVILSAKKDCRIAAVLSMSKKSGWSWAFSDRYGRMGKGDARCWNAGKWIEIW